MQVTHALLNAMIAEEFDAAFRWGGLGPDESIPAASVRRIAEVVAFRTAERLGALNDAKRRDQITNDRLADEADRRHKAWCTATGNRA